MNQDSHDEIIIFAILIIPVTWFALLITPYLDKGLFEMMNQLNSILEHPFSITWSQNSLRSISIILIAYGLGVGIYFSSRKNHRRNIEYGSAKWGNAHQVTKKYQHSHFQENKILSQNIRIGLDGKKHRRNLNSLIVGGSGAGKTRFFALPNLMQCNTSFVCLDPKGEILRTVGHLLEKQGYVIKIIDLINMELSHCYNPFVYIHNDNDVLKLINNLIRNTTPKGSTNNDPFWESVTCS